MHEKHASRPANERSGASTHSAHIGDEPDGPDRHNKPLHGRSERRRWPVFLAPFLIRLPAADWAELSTGIGRPGLFRDSGRLERSGIEGPIRASFVVVEGYDSVSARLDEIW